MLLVSVLETHRAQVKRGLSMFLENARQEMPSTHLELLYSGSLSVTAEASEVLPGPWSTRAFFVPLSWSIWRPPATHSWPGLVGIKIILETGRQRCSWNAFISSWMHIETSSTEPCGKTAVYIQVFEKCRALRHLPMMASRGRCNAADPALLKLNKKLVTHEVLHVI